MFDDIDADALSPNIELLDRRSAKSVGGHEQNFLARVAVLRREFADSGGFADAVDAEK